MKMYEFDLKPKLIFRMRGGVNKIFVNEGKISYISDTVEQESLVDAWKLIKVAFSDDFQNPKR